MTTFKGLLTAAGAASKKTGKTVKASVKAPARTPSAFEGRVARATTTYGGARPAARPQPRAQPSGAGRALAVAARATGGRGAAASGGSSFAARIARATGGAGAPAAARGPAARPVPALSLGDLAGQFMFPSPKAVRRDIQTFARAVGAHTPSDIAFAAGLSPAAQGELASKHARAVAQAQALRHGASGRDLAGVLPGYTTEQGAAIQRALLGAQRAGGIPTPFLPGTKGYTTAQDIAAIQKVRDTAATLRKSAVGRAQVASSFGGKTVTPEEIMIADAKKLGVPQGSLFGNLAGDALGVITGIPSFAALAAKNIGAAGALGYAALPGVPGGGAAEKWAESVSQEDWQAAKAIGQDYARRYGPLFTGDLSTFKARLAEHPGSFALDAAAAVSALGAATRVGLKTAAAFSPEGSAAREWAARMASKSVLPGTARYEPPRALTETIGGGGTTIHVPRRPLTPNPLTRPVQRAIRRGKEKFTQEMGRYSQELLGPRGHLTPEQARVEVPGGWQGVAGRAARWLGPEGQFQRAGARQFRAANVARGGEVMRQTAALTRPYVESVRHLGSVIGRDLIGRNHEEVALHLHTEGLLDVPGLTGVQARDRLVRTMLEEQAARPWLRNAKSMRNIQAIQDIPANLLDLRTAPERLQHAVAERTALVGKSQELAVEAGVITPETARTIGAQSAQIIHGGMRWDPAAVKRTPEVQAARAETAAARSHLASVMSQAGAVRRLLPTVRVTKKGETVVRRGPLVQAGVRIGRGEERVRGTVAARPGVGPTGARRVGYEQQLLGQGDVARLRGMPSPRPRDIVAARNRLAAALRAQRRVERQNRGDFTVPDPYSPTPGGVYQPHIPVDRPGLRGIFTPRGRALRITPEPTYQRTGFNLLTGNFTTDKMLPVYAAGRAVAASVHANMIDDLVRRFAAKDSSGQVIRDSRKVLDMTASADPNKWAFIRVSSLKSAIGKGADLEAGKFLDRAELSSAFLTPTSAKDLLEGGRATDVVAVPKSVADAIQQSMQPSNQILRGYDTVLNAWRAGILAFAPRWYLNNLTGNTLQFGLLAGWDIGAIRQAARPEFRDIYPAEVQQTLAREAGGAVAGRLGAQHTPLGRATHAGYDANQYLEGTIRRGAYLATAKQVLRAEGTKTRTRGPGAISNAELADRVANMSPEVAGEVIRRFNLFMGDYQNLSPFERNVMRRIFPFYSWLRVIGKLTLTLPIHHPIRAEAVALASKMGTAAENPGDFMLPWYQRGRINLPGGLAIRTSGANPFGTWGGAISAAGTGDISGAVTQVASGGFNPFVQAALQQVAGKNLYTGSEFTAPPGWGGISQGLFSNTQWNPATGRFDRVDIKPPWWQSITEAIPPVSTIRTLVSAGRSPYDVASTQDLLFNLIGAGPPSSQLYQPPPRYARGATKIPGISAIGSYVGLPVVQVDRKAEADAYRRNIQRGLQAQRKSAAKARRASRGG